MLFDNLPENLTEKEFAEFMKNKFRLLRAAIYKLLPEKCFLKPNKLLSVGMLDMIDIEMIEQNVVEAKDICAICVENRCPYFKIGDRSLRIRNLEMINKKNGRSN